LSNDVTVEYTFEAYTSSLEISVGTLPVIYVGSSAQAHSLRSLTHPQIQTSRSPSARASSSSRCVCPRGLGSIRISSFAMCADALWRQTN
jgi:hypothetical protein